MSLVLTACGGSGSGPNSTQAENPPATIQIQPFSADPFFLPDLKAKYDKLCGRNVNAQQIIPVDLNNDGRKDFVVAVWCPQSVFGQNIDTPVKNTIIALIQTADGNFFDATAQVFGSDMPDIGGVATSHTAHDFNNDGYTDIVFSISREDGRVGTGSMENFKSRQMSLMSNGNGTYRLVPIGDLKWGMNVSLRSNSSNNKDIVFTAFHSVRSGYRWSGAEWQEVSGYSEWVNNPLFLNSIPNVAIQAGPRDQLGVDLFALNNNIWNKTSGFSYAGSTIWVDIISWAGGVGKAPVIKINGEDYLTPGFANFCEIKTDNATKVIAFMYGTIIEGGYKGGTLREGNDPVYKYKNVNKLLIFNVEGTSLSKDAIELDLSNEPSHLAFYEMKCNDLNGDGIPDIHVVAPLGWSGNPAPAPIVFLGQAGFTFKRVKSEVFPLIPNGAAALIIDITGDTLPDLVYWPLNGYTGADMFQGHHALIRSDSVKYKLYKGIRNFYSSDLR